MILIFMIIFRLLESTMVKIRISRIILGKIPDVLIRISYRL